MQKHTLRLLVKELRHLRALECHNEARMKLAMTINMFPEVKILSYLDSIQGIEKVLPRAIERYRAVITERLLRHLREHHGQEATERITQALLG